jgi:CRP-like cAMP-binding protein
MPRTKNNFDLEAFLAAIGQGRKIVRVRKKSKVYAQGYACDTIFYIKKGKIKLLVLALLHVPAGKAVLNLAIRPFVLFNDNYVNSIVG